MPAPPRAALAFALTQLIPPPRTPQFKSNLQSLQAQLGTAGPPGSQSRQQLTEQIVQLRTSHRQQQQEEREKLQALRASAASAGAWPFTTAPGASTSSSTSSDVNTDTSIGQEIAQTKKENATLNAKYHSQWVSLTEQIAQAPPDSTDRLALEQQRKALVSQYAGQESALNITLSGFREQAQLMAEQASSELASEVESSAVSSSSSSSSSSAGGSSSSSSSSEAAGPAAEGPEGAAAAARKRHHKKRKAGPNAATHERVRETREEIVQGRETYRTSMDGLKAQLVAAPAGSPERASTLQQMQSLKASQASQEASLNATLVSLLGQLPPPSWVLSTAPVAGNASSTSTSSSEVVTSTEVGAQIHSIKQENATLNAQTHKEFVALQQQIAETPAGPAREGLITQRGELIKSYHGQEAVLRTRLKGLRKQLPGSSSSTSSSSSSSEASSSSGGSGASVYAQIRTARQQRRAANVQYQQALSGLQSSLAQTPRGTPARARAFPREPCGVACSIRPCLAARARGRRTRRWRRTSRSWPSSTTSRWRRST